MALAITLTPVDTPKDTDKQVNGFEQGIDYMQEMKNVVRKGGDNALSEGRKLEEARNRKIDWLATSDIPYTNFFSGEYSLGEIRYYLGVSKYIYTEADVDLLARLINAEAGCDWIPDWVKRDVGSVVLNRMASPNMPNTLYEVIYQPGVYGCVNNGTIYWRPTQSSVEAARYILDNGSTLPSYVTGQGPYQGTIYKSYYDPILGTTIYFSY